MATVLFAAAGAALGAGFGGTVLGLSGAVIGRAVGATLGRSIDQRLMGLGSDAVEVGRVDRFRVMGASEGTPVARTWGRMRRPGQVIWASPFTEISARSGGGKGMPKPRSVQFSYTVSLAIALCEGEILGIGRIWADGAEIDPSTLDLRVYTGSPDQMPDPAIEADLGFGMAPSYRDTAYVVIENMDLSPFGSRVPQLSFEVVRQANADGVDGLVGYDDMIKAVALIPGTGEYALATEKVNMPAGPFVTRPTNVNSRSGVSNFVASYEQLKRELPKCQSMSLVVSWFGEDLRCGQCQIQPKVEQTQIDAVNMPWRAGGITRTQAAVIAQQDNRPIYGGTPADASVIQAIQAANADDRKIMFYPFILMDQLAGNERPDPYGISDEQPVLPWRGRITLSVAPGRPGSPDSTSTAAAEVEMFFGSALTSDFTISGAAVSYSGAAQWGYRRFILHYAHLCKLAGGVDAFCIGSELRGLTQIRGENHTFPVVDALRQLAADVRAVLGPKTKISYAADWSEYFGYHVGDDVYFHLDPLWADPNIDFIGIDNYMPISDWRGEETHLDKKWKSIGNIDYLKSGICGGEGFDWYYDGEERRLAQLRTPIVDTAHGEHWVFRYKDLPSWWSNTHHNRIGGLRQDQPTSWIPRSKPIWFTEYGCPAIDKGTNEPNKFIDLKSSESSIPNFSNGFRDDYLQFQYYRAIHDYWGETTNNPASDLYAGRMLDTDRFFAWAWDARPFPEFPGNEKLWSDSRNFDRGHWLNGRASSVSLGNLVRELCANMGIGEVDTHDLHGLVSGFEVADLGSVRSMVQPLSVSYGFDAVERDGKIAFISRGIADPCEVSSDVIALTDDENDSFEISRASDADIVGRFRLTYVSSDGDFSIKTVESSFTDGGILTVSQLELPITLTDNQAKSIVERWLAETCISRDYLKLRLPASVSDVRAGSIVNFSGVNYRVDRVESDAAKMVEAVRTEASHYALRNSESERVNWSGYAAPSSILPIWMDLPMLTGTEIPYAPHIAATAIPWSGTVGVWSSQEDDCYTFVTALDSRAIIGSTLTPLALQRPGLFDRGPALHVRLESGELSSAQGASVLNGSNTIVIGDGTPENWEVFQFERAVLVAEKTYELSRFLRGQAGSDAIIPDEWPIGSIVVLIDQSASQVPLQASFRNIVRHYRVGAVERGFADDSTTHHVLSFKGNGLRPYRVSHLRTVTGLDGDSFVSWIRRTRIDGDSWESFEVPLGEATERYQISILSESGRVGRSLIVTNPFYTYTFAEKVADGIVAPFRVEVSQISDSFGLGPVARVDVLS